MRRFHVRQNLRSAFFLVVLGVVLAIPFTLWKVNRVGLPAEWRLLIVSELEKQNLHLEIGAIRYVPLRGIVASEVRVFADPERRIELSRMERILLDFDKTKLARGELRLNKMQLSNARVLIPSDPADPTAETLELNQVSATVLMPGGRVFEIRDARGLVGGIDVVFSARLLSYRSSGTGGLPGQDAEGLGKRREFIARIVREMERWNYPEDQRPKARVRIDGNLSDVRSFTTSFTFDAPRLAMNHHALRDIRIEGGMDGRMLSIDHAVAHDDRGGLFVNAEYDLTQRNGRFAAESGLDLVLLMRSWFGVAMPDPILVGGIPAIKVAGNLQFREGSGMPEIDVTGAFGCDSVMLRGVVFDRVETAFAIRGKDVFLRDAKLQRPDGEARGKAMIEWPLVRVHLESSLPPPVYRPLFVGMPLEQVIDSFTVNPKSSVHVVIDGGFDVEDRFSWAYRGHGRAEHVAYRGVPIISADTKFAVSHHELDFREGRVTFDTSRYAQRLAHRGPPQVSARVEGIRYVGKDRLLHIDGVSGEFWVPPVLRLFHPDLAKQIEAYEFHRPPKLEAGGIIDVTPAGRTRFDVRFESRTPAAMELLGEKITFTRAAGRVRLRGNRVEVRDLDLAAFGGPVKATVTHENDRLQAEVSWTGLDLPALAGAYGVTMQGGGTTTGQIGFSIRGGNLGTLSGSGNANFENAHLFAVPIFGPLSPLLSAIVDDRRAGYEPAKDAFFSFQIQDGMMRSGDFHTTTNSLVFTGDGELDLKQKTVDMTMRVNARGLLGFITLPLRPFYGFFQFRGSGAMREPVWESVMFTPPSDRQKEQLMNPPKARVVAEP